MLTDKKALTWRSQGRTFTLLFDAGASPSGALLVLPTQQCLELPADDWRALADAIHRALPADGKHPRADKPEKADKPDKPAADQPANAGKPWTPQQTDDLTSAWLQGATIAALAQHNQRTAGAVRAKLIGLGYLGRFDSDEDADALPVPLRAVPFKDRLASGVGARASAPHPEPAPAPQRAPAPPINRTHSPPPLDDDDIPF